MLNKRSLITVIMAALLLAPWAGKHLWGLSDHRSAASTVQPLNDSALHIPPPRQLRDLIDRADLIVSGVVKRVVSEGYFQGYDSDGEVIASRPYTYSEAHPVDPNVPFVDYEVAVRDVILGDGGVGVSGSVIVRAMGIQRAKADPNPGQVLVALGDYRLFFLKRNPDGRTYGSYYGQYGRLIIDQPLVAFSDQERTPVSFSEGALTAPVTPDEFLRLIRELVASR